MTSTQLAPPPNGTTGTTPAVTVRGLRKSYGGRAVLDGLDLDVRRGECFALLGPNGAGKTTTIEVLEGVRRRDAGQVLVLGADPATAGRDWRARIGVVSQGEGAGQALSVRETLDHFAAYSATPRPTDELLAAVGLAEQAGTRVARLSGGQRRRLAVALGVQGSPDLLFLDEPTTGMDPVARRRFWQLIRDLRAGGTTVLLTTHYLDEAAELADRVGVVAGGRLVDVAPPAELGAHLRRQALARVRTRARAQENADALVQFVRQRARVGHACRRCGRRRSRMSWWPSTPTTSPTPRPPAPALPRPALARGSPPPGPAGWSPPHPPGGRETGRELRVRRLLGVHALVRASTWCTGSTAGRPPWRTSVCCANGTTPRRITRSRSSEIRMGDGTPTAPMAPRSRSQRWCSRASVSWYLPGASCEPGQVNSSRTNADDERSEEYA